MTQNGTFQAAQQAATALLRGATPADVLRNEVAYGDWTAILHRLADAYAEGGTAAVARLFDVMARADRRVAALVAGSSSALNPIRSSMPPLPVEAAAISAHTAPCGEWLDQYIDFARQAAPMTPRSFHEAAGLFLMSASIARRLVFSSGTDSTYPTSLYCKLPSQLNTRKRPGSVLHAACSTPLACRTYCLRRA